MKYIKRILMLPFAWVLWTISLSIQWIRFGGNLIVKAEKNVINPEELLSELKRLNINLEKTNIV